MMPFLMGHVTSCRTRPSAGFNNHLATTHHRRSLIAVREIWKGFPGGADVVRGLIVGPVWISR